MTLKAARLIRSADVVAYHAGPHGNSVARSIAADLIPASWSQLELPARGAPRRRVVTATSPAESALALIAESAVDLFGSDRREDLRACVRDHPRRQWCSAACGNRARVSRHYARHHGRP